MIGLHLNNDRRKRNWTAPEFFFQKIYNSHRKWSDKSDNGLIRGEKL